MSDETLTPASAESEAVDSSERLASLSESDRSEWFKTGNLPDAKPGKGDDSDDDPPSPEAPAASKVPEAPAPVPAVSKRQQQINDLIRDRAEAQRERDEARRELDAARNGQPAPKSGGAQPPPLPAPAGSADQPEPRPDLAAMLEAGKTWDDWDLADKEWVADRRFEKRQAAERAAADRHAERTGFETAANAWIQRRDAFAATSPVFTEKAVPLLDKVFPNTPIGDVILLSDVGPQVALHLAEHPAEFARISGLHPVNALRELGKIEAKFDTPATPASAAIASPKVVSDAPAPPVTLGSKTANSALDDPDDAVARGDFRAYAALETKRDLASRK